MHARNKHMQNTCTHYSLIIVRLSGRAFPSLLLNQPSIAYYLTVMGFTVVGLPVVGLPVVGLPVVGLPVVGLPVVGWAFL